jgi:UDP-2-acetamido-3-amino-2,3-dideoxy-glucuronate N-acetyltransferase
MKNKGNIIDPTVIISESASIGSYNIIEEGVQIGKNVKIGNFNHIKKKSIFSENTIIGNYCELGEYTNAAKNVIIQGRVRMADNCTFEDSVTIKYGTILTSKVLLKKKCFLGPNVITLGSTHKRITKHGTIIGENCFIGAGTKIAADIRIGDHIITGTNSFVNKDIISKGIYAGTPIKFIKK